MQAVVLSLTGSWCVSRHTQLCGCCVGAFLDIVECGLEIDTCPLGLLLNAWLLLAGFLTQQVDMKVSLLPP